MKLATIIKDTNINIDEVVLFRHNLSKKEVKQVYNEGFRKSITCLRVK